MIITKASFTDLDEIMNIVSCTRLYFKNVGIPQWQGEYPDRIDFEEDKEKERLYVIKEDNKVIGMFSLVYPDHNYDYIEDGKWLDDTPYIAIHRMAILDEYKGRGYAGKAFDYVKENYDHIRVDTHDLNEAMKRAILKNNFVYCGIVYMEDKTKRNAYEWSRKGLDILNKPGYNRNALSRY